ncbi:hypothetical protein COY13_01590 [Candidatus Roizmanbacteria bacterium CG_4_10_14_0_2_um_filter_36_35]|uniref:Uncharacterized protein n=2 Tax=Candidatus Roizmaniibacteriota TaxID=1752723 RepID=A0A2M7UAG4_9BACT|nr:MAG: hypothetical protein COY13_01590 [Candidatus Roizmanbacteria bacterium CG_4_10_14_0_2_um_filter_36_35]PJC30730.1 MAG: hypothetical protein CO049_04870 [Candidatus Roizmanbacteria bacterium CG_4_9_14_0_2_um_filter_36_12]
MYHGIILDKEFKNREFVNFFKIFNKRKSTDTDWLLYGIEVEDEVIKETIKEIQNNLKENELYYTHLYNRRELIVIFKNKVFYTTLDKSTWKEFVDYGLNLGIPREQLNVAPIKFEEEKDYFST